MSIVVDMSIVSPSRGLPWVAVLSLTGLLLVPVGRLLAQPTSSAATPADCEIQLQLSNPAPGATAVPQTVVINGIALDQTSTEGPGIAEVQAFAGARDAGGIFLGDATFLDGMAPGSWTLPAMFPDAATGNVQLFVYAISSVSGQEAGVGVPIVVGPGALDQSATPDIACPATLNQPMSITDIDWMWTSATDSAGGAMSVDDPNQYTLTLQADGTFHAQADCNLTSGGFTMLGTDLSLSIGPTTLAECAPGSLFNQYLSNLGDVSGFTVDDSGNLVLSLGDSGATMVFTPATSAHAE
jgi:heat shock protein HslJ